MLCHHKVELNALAIWAIDRLIYNKGLELRGVITLRCSNISLFRWSGCWCWLLWDKDLVCWCAASEPCSGCCQNVPVKCSSKLHCLSGLNTVREKWSLTALARVFLCSQVSENQAMFPDLIGRNETSCRFEGVDFGFWLLRIRIAKKTNTYMQNILSLKLPLINLRFVALDHTS